MKRRRHHEEEHPNHERWLVSYADFITLLFAFFVVMYSISSINEGKYRILSETLNEVFSDRVTRAQPERTLNPIQIGQIKRTEHLLPENPPVTPNVTNPSDDPSQAEQTQLAAAAEQIERVLAPYIQDDLIAVKKENSWVEIELKSGLLFASGSAELTPTVIPMIEKLADIFNTLDSPINVEGHTDNKPIATREFPSNWELSANRAASVVHQLMKNGVKPARMAAIGYGEHHPIADNTNEEGRYKNRRVVIVIQSKAMARFARTPDVPSTGNQQAPPGSQSLSLKHGHE